MSAMNPDQLLSNLQLAEVNTMKQKYSEPTPSRVHLHFKIAF